MWAHTRPFVWSLRERQLLRALFRSGLRWCVVGCEPESWIRPHQSDGQS